MGLKFQNPSFNILRKIPSQNAIFPEYSLSVPQHCNIRDIQGTLWNILKEEIFQKSSWWKSCFCVKSLWFYNNKCWSFIKFQWSRSNVFRVFKEDSTNVCFKNIPRISPEYCKVMRIFLEVKKLKKMFCGLSCENFKIGSLLSCNVFLNLVETVLQLK